MNRDFAVEPDTVRLIDLKTGPCKEFNIIYGNTTNRVSNFTELAENTLEKTIDNKVKIKNSIQFCLQGALITGLPGWLIQ